MTPERELRERLKEFLDSGFVALCVPEEEVLDELEKLLATAPAPTPAPPTGRLIVYPYGGKCRLCGEDVSANSGHYCKAPAEPAVPEREPQAGDKVLVRAILLRTELVDGVLWADVEVNGAQVDFKFRDILPASALAAAPREHPQLGVHLQHCNFGEYPNECKYGDEDCPALTESWSWFGRALQRSAAPRAEGGERDSLARAFIEAIQEHPFDGYTLCKCRSEKFDIPMEELAKKHSIVNRYVFEAAQRKAYAEHVAQVAEGFAVQVGSRRAAGGRGREMKLSEPLTDDERKQCIAWMRSEWWSGPYRNGERREGQNAPDKENPEAFHSLRLMYLVANEYEQLLAERRAAPPPASLQAEGK